jgi:APA family basic amino acid/polyamine antiporter
MSATPSLSRRLGFGAVVAVIVGNMLGAGIFYTPGELAAVAERTWQIYFFWALCGAVTLCGALTVAELAALVPRAGATFHIIHDGFGPFWAFLKAWTDLWVTGPGSVAGIAILFGELLTGALGPAALGSPAGWGVLAIATLALVNLAGLTWGARAQMATATVKVLGLGGLVVGSMMFADAAVPPVDAAVATGSVMSLLPLIGLGTAIVLFTYDGWLDVTHVAGEVVDPVRQLPRGLVTGVSIVIALYLLVNHAFLRVVPLSDMRDAPTMVAPMVATAIFGPSGGAMLNTLMVVSIFGALGGVVMTVPRLLFAGASHYAELARAAAPGVGRLVATLARVSSRKVPAGAILFCAVWSSAALLFFGSFSRIVAFFVVPVQVANILIVAAVFRFRRRGLGAPGGYRTPGYPLVPLVYIGVLSLLLATTVAFNPTDTLIGVALTATGAPVYGWLTRAARTQHG